MSILSTQRLRVAVAGCGEVAQIMHIPYLSELNTHFDLVAVTDVSPSVARRVAERYRVPKWYTDYKEMLAAEKPDAVVVLTSNEYHAPISIDAMKSGAHVLVEKPMCISPQEGEEMVRVAEAEGKVLMVAYMKRYDPNYQLGQALLQRLMKEKGKPDYIRVHDFCHNNGKVIADVYDIIRPENDIPAAAAEERNALLEMRLKEALGDVSQEVRSAYLLLLGLASHDMTVLRGIYGDPKEILFTRFYQGGRGILSVMDYDGFLCTFEIGVSDRMWMDESVVAWYPTTEVTIDFPSPYIKNAETKVVQKETTSDLRTTVSEQIASRDESFRRELLEFHAAITEGRQALTNGREGLRDVEILREIALKGM